MTPGASRGRSRAVLQADAVGVSEARDFIGHKGRARRLMLVHEERFVGFDPATGAPDGAELLPSCPLCGARGDEWCRDLSK